MHTNPQTGLPCECSWGEPKQQPKGWDFRTASDRVRKVRNQNQKAFRTQEGAEFLNRLERLLDQNPDADALAEWFAQQYKKGYLDLTPDWTEEHGAQYAHRSGIRVKNANQDLSFSLPVFSQWMNARQHPMRQGKNPMEMSYPELYSAANELRQDVAAKQEKKNWLANYGDYWDEPEHVFGPEAGEYQGWTVQQIDDEYKAQAETDALGHCIGSEEQPYCNNIGAGNIVAYSLRDREGHPKVTWHHNPDGTLAHVQGKSGYPDAERRQLISQFNEMHGLDDDGGGSGEDRLDQLEGGIEYDYHIQGPEIRDLEDYETYLGDDGHYNTIEWAQYNGYNLDPEDYDGMTETEPGPINWPMIVREIEDRWANESIEPETSLYYSDSELDNFYDAVKNHGQEFMLEQAIMGSTASPGSNINMEDWEEEAVAPRAAMTWMHYNNMIDEDWVPFEQRPPAPDPTREPPVFPAPQQAPAGPPAAPPPGQMSLEGPNAVGQDEFNRLFPEPQGDPNEPFHPQTNPAGWVTPPNPLWGQVGAPVPVGRQANILDPIHETLDRTVFDHADKDTPKLKPRHRKWIKETIYRVLDNAGYDGMDEWLQLVFTGSLTTYQYSADSDVDVSLFVNVDKLPEWSRAEMIGLMVENFDGDTLPGTTHPTQGFVVPSDVDVTDLYKPGLRSGYDLENDSWIVPPEKGRTMDVQREKNGAYVHALEQADKMDRLLKYEPDKAVMFWHQIHKRRRRDHKAGKGDYSESNITYKMLANRGLFPAISDVSGEYIASTDKRLFDPIYNAKVALEQAQGDWAWNPQQPPPQEMRLNQKGCSYCGATLNPTDTVCPQCLNSNAPQTSTEWQNLPHALNQPAQPVSKVAALLPPQEHIEHARHQLGLQHPVRVLPTYKNRGGYAGVSRDPMTGKPSHLLYVNPEQHPGARNWSLWHELGHAQRVEQGGQFEPNNELSDEEYWEHPNEQHAEGVADQYADYDLFAKQGAPKTKHSLVRKWVYNGDTQQLVIGPLAREEGEVSSHNQLAMQTGGADLCGTVNARGYVQFEDGALGKPPTGRNQYQVRYEAQEALKNELGGDIAGFLGGEQEDLGWDQGWTE